MKRDFTYGQKLEIRKNSQKKNHWALGAILLGRGGHFSQNHLMNIVF